VIDYPHIPQRGYIPQPRVVVIDYPHIPQRGYIPQPRVVAQPRTLGYQPDFTFTLKALYKCGRDAVPL